MPELDIGSVIKKETMHQAAYKQLKHAILSGKLTPDHFYTETDFAHVLNISRTPVREAVKDLIHDNLLLSVPRKGLKVREFTESEVEQIFLVRKAIESQVIGQLLKTVTEEQISFLENLVEDQKRAIETDDRIAFIRLDQKFHHQMIRFVHYELIEELIIKLHNLTRLIGHQAIKKQGRREEVIREHQEILEALKRGDSDQAKQAMVTHLENTQQSYRMVKTKSDDRRDSK
ncbi:GntR family transcriptional regulator [Desmospora sp. 8437]|nr:GntR family transcriptional regulator [Desmospora sp. 8437]